MTESVRTQQIPRWRRALTLATTVAILLMGVWVISSRWTELEAAAKTIGISRLLAAILLSTASILATGESWRRWLEALAPGVPGSTAHRIFYATQVGKYVPGGVWPILGQLTLARRFRVPRTAMLAATSLFLATHVVTGIAVGILAFRAQMAEWMWLVFPLALLGAIALSPPIIRRTGSMLLKRIADDAVMPSIPASTTVTSGLMMVVAWIGYGLATQILLSPFGAEAHDLLLVTGAYALSWVVGFFAFLAPAGLGAREGALVALLAPTVGLTPALAISLMSRMAGAVGDVVLGAASASIVGEAAAPATPSADL